MDTDNDQQEEETFNSTESNGKIFVLLLAFYLNLLQKLVGYGVTCRPSKVFQQAELRTTATEPSNVIIS